MLEQSLDRTKATRYIILCKKNDESMITFTRFLSVSLPFYSITLYQLLEPSITYLYLIFSISPSCLKPQTILVENTNCLKSLTNMLMKCVQVQAHTL